MGGKEEWGKKAPRRGLKSGHAEPGMDWICPISIFNLTGLLDGERLYIS